MVWAQGLLGINQQSYRLIMESQKKINYFILELDNHFK